MAQIVEKVRYFYEDPAGPDEGAAKVLCKKPESRAVIERYAASVAEAVPDERWRPGEHAALEAHARQLSEREGVSLGDLAQPLRAVLTGRSATPGLFEVMAILGKEACLRRLSRAGEMFIKGDRPL